ncbi:heme-binding domain-containing protein [Tenacibaculum xiamenense]|uniref:heme-binding domain-containing protein n=1 Tax=Tenacibaculum xiamenense TaxID=1261553 RepID=UPI0038960FC9
MRGFKVIAGIVLSIFLIAQLFRPEKNLGEYKTLKVFLKETKVTPNVEVIIKKACLDCHSAVTKYPWYSNITPINFWMAEHIKEGKSYFDFSIWEQYSSKEKKHHMKEIYFGVKENKVPLKSYLVTHKEARLSDSEKQTLMEWAKLAQEDYELIQENSY